MLIRHLLESFSAPYPYKEEYSSGDAKLLSFTSNNSTQYEVAIELTSDDAEWEVVFFVKGTSSFKKTGTGDEFRVFATVISIIKDFVKTNKPNRVSFSADVNEPSRISLYKTLAKRYTPPGYTCHIRMPISDADDVMFVFLRVNK